MKSIFKAIIPKPVTFTKYNTNQDVQQTKHQTRWRSSISEPATTATCGPPVQSKFWHENRSHQKLMKPLPPSAANPLTTRAEGYLLWSTPLAENKCKVSIESQRRKNLWVDTIWQCSPLLPCLLSCYSRYPTCARSVCLNKKADKEYSSVSSIWSPRLFETIWVYLAGHADSLWTIYHRKKLQRLALCQCLVFSSLPQPLFSPPGYWCYIKTNPQFT